MKTINKCFLIITVLIAISCDDETDHDQKATFSVKILSPKDNSFYYLKNTIGFYLEVYDSLGNWTEMDSQKWVSSLDGVFIRFDGPVSYSTSLSSPGLHKITGYAYKGDKIAYDDVTVLVTDSLYLRVKFNNNIWTVYDVPTQQVWTIEHDKLNNIYVGTVGSGIIVRKNNLWTFFTAENAGLISNEIQCIEVDDKNNIYVGHGYNNGINKYDGSNWSTIPMPDAYYDVHTIAFRNDTLWAGDHVGRIIFFTGMWHTIPSQPRFFGHPGKIAFDDNGVLWGNSEHGGSFRYDGSTWSIFDPNTNGMSVCSYELAIDHQNHIWFGTCDEGLYAYDGSIWTILNTSNSSLPSNSITALCTDAFNNIWVGTDKGLAKYNQNGWTIFNTSNSPIPDNLITTVTVDDSNNVWIGAGGRSITLFKNN